MKRRKIKTLIELFLMTGFLMIQFSVFAEELKPDRTIRLRPRVHVKPGKLALPFDWNAIQPFLKRDRVLPVDTHLKEIPTILVIDEDLQEGLVKLPSCEPYEMATVQFFSSPQKIEEGLKRKKILGYNLKQLAEGQILKCDHASKVAKFSFSNPSQPLSIGDLLFPKDEHFMKNRHFAPGHLAKPGVVLGSKGNLYGQMDTLMVNLGKESGVSIGNWFNVYRTNPQLKQFAQSKKIGRILIYNVFDKVSYGVILNASQSLEPLDEIKSD